jgi:deoxyadenosine/deoxycytidine kinase
MLICVEGPLGVGKSTLVRLLAQMFPCQTVYEDAERNPFLHEYYHLPEQERWQIAEHVQYTFLFLQDWQLRTNLALSRKETAVLTDFHPLKSLIFGKIIFAV